MIYSKRKQLSNDFIKWASKNYAAVCPENVITWLDGEGLLKEKDDKNIAKNT